MVKPTSMSESKIDTAGGITINDIARELNISPSTVSRALNDSSKISEKTRNEVKAVAARLGYQINQTASALSKNKTNVLGVLLPRLNSHFFSKALSGIEAVAQAKGYRILICQSNDNRQQEEEMVKLLLASRVDGVVACLAMDSSGDHFNILVKNKIPVAMFDRVNFNIPGSKVVVDNYDGAFRATEHLIQNGYRRIAHLAGSLSCKAFEERINGYKDALSKNGIALEPQMVLSCNLDEKDTREAFMHWMRMPAKPDAIFTASASSGLAICAMAKAMGISIPAELGIISFGSEPCHDLITPTLSSVDMPGSEMGKTAAELLIEAIENKTQAKPLILTPIKLLVRNSSFRP